MLGEEPPAGRSVLCRTPAPQDQCRTEPAYQACHVRCHPLVLYYSDTPLFPWSPFLILRPVTIRQKAQPHLHLVTLMRKLYYWPCCPRQYQSITLSARPPGGGRLHVGLTLMPPMAQAKPRSPMDPRNPLKTIGRHRLQRWRRDRPWRHPPPATPL